MWTLALWTRLFSINRQEIVPQWICGTGSRERESTSVIRRQATVRVQLQHATDQLVNDVLSLAVLLVFVRFAAAVLILSRSERRLQTMLSEHDPHSLIHWNLVQVFLTDVWSHNLFQPCKERHLSLRQVYHPLDVAKRNSRTDCFRLVVKPSMSKTLRQDYSLFDHDVLHAVRQENGFVQPYAQTMNRSVDRRSLRLISSPVKKESEQDWQASPGDCDGR